MHYISILYGNIYEVSDIKRFNDSNDFGACLRELTVNVMTEAKRKKILIYGKVLKIELTSLNMQNYGREMGSFYPSYDRYSEIDLQKFEGIHVK